MSPFESIFFNQKTIRNITRFLVFVMGVTLALHFLLVVIFPNSPEFIRHQFNVGDEGNWATWFNGTLALIAGIAAVMVGLLRTHKQLYISRWVVLSWMGIGAVFALISIDDQLALHDKLRPELRAFLGRTIENFPDQIGFYAWYVVLGVPAAMVAIFMLRFLYKHAWRFVKARNLIIIGFILLASNPITEVLEDLPSKLIQDPSVSTYDELAKKYPEVVVWDNFFMMLQEFTEMMGLILVASAFLHVGQGILAEAAAHDSRNSRTSSATTNGVIQRDVSVEA